MLGASGCASVPCLQRLSAAELLYIYAARRYSFTPTIDGVDLCEPLGAAFAAGRVAPDVPLVAGATHEDLGAGLAPAQQPVPLPSCAPALCAAVAVTAAAQSRGRQNCRQNRRHQSCRRWTASCWLADASAGSTHTSLSRVTTYLVQCVAHYLQRRCSAPSFTVVKVTTWYGVLNFTCHLV